MAHTYINTDIYIYAGNSRVESTKMAVAQKSGERLFRWGFFRYGRIKRRGRERKRCACESIVSLSRETGDPRLHILE